MDPEAGPLDRFRVLVRDGAATVHVVTITGVTNPHSRETTWQVRKLDLDADLRAQFKAMLSRTLQTLARLQIDRYEPGWVPAEGELAEARMDVLEDSPLLRQILGAVQPGVGAGGLPEPPAMAADEDFGPINAYGIVVGRVRDGHEETAVFVRNQTPVEELRPGRVTAVWHNQRLERARRLLTFDAGIDVAILDPTVLIKSSRGFERLFVPPDVRIAGAKRAVDLLVAHVPVANLAELREVAERDSVFGSKLRLLGKTGLLDGITIERLRLGLQETGLADVFIREGQLSFPAEQVWRWRFLEALEDSFVRSTGTGILYRSASKKRWQRRLVQGAVVLNGRVSALCGPGWGPTHIDEIERDITRAQAVYFVDLPDGAHNLTAADLAPTADGQPTLPALRGLGACP